MSSLKGNSQEEKNKNFIRSYIDKIFNKHNLSSSIQRYFGGSFIEGSSQAGKGGIGSNQFINRFLTACSDWHTAIEYLVAENDIVVVFLNGYGTHNGEFLGIHPPTNP
jgi:hypothetical protein